MQTTKTTTDLSYNVSRDIQSPYADAKYAFGRVKVTYVEYIKAEDAFASAGPWPVTSGYSAEIIEPSVLTAGKVAWELVRGDGETAIEATRNLLDKIDSALRAMPQIIAETGN